MRPVPNYIYRNWLLGCYAQKGAIMANYKNEMKKKVNEFMAEYETGTADMSLLEAMAETLLQSANMAGIETSEALDYIDAYCEDFIPENLANAMKALKKEVEAA